MDQVVQVVLRHVHHVADVQTVRLLHVKLAVLHAVVDAQMAVDLDAQVLAVVHVADAEDVQKFVLLPVRKDVQDVLHLALCHVLAVEAVVPVKAHVLLAVSLHVQEGAARAALVDVLLDAQVVDPVVVLAQAVQETVAANVQEHAALLAPLGAVAAVAADLDVVENVLQVAREVVVAHARPVVVMLVQVADLDVQTLVLVDVGALAVVVVLQLAEDAPAVLEIVIVPVELVVRINAQVLVVRDAAGAKDVQAHAELVVVVTAAEHVKPAVAQDVGRHVAELVKQIVAEHVQDVVQLVLVDVLHVLDVVDVQDVQVIVLDVLDVRAAVKAVVVIAVILLALKPVIPPVTLVLPQFTKRTK